MPLPFPCPGVVLSTLALISLLTCSCAVSDGLAASDRLPWPAPLDESGDTSSDAVDTPDEPAPAGFGQLLSGTTTDADETDDWHRKLIDPVTQPYWFESPLITTEVRPIYIRHEFPDSSIAGGGHLTAYALQLRYALTPRLAVITVKDGRVDFNPDGLPHGQGNTDIAGGLKYALYEDPDAGQIVTAGLVYEMNNGDAEVLQGNGNGVWRPFVSGGLDAGPINYLALVGANIPVDGAAESESLDYHLHVSWEATESFWPLLEINGVHYTADGKAFPTDEELLDYGNLGSTNVKNTDVITGALGFRWRLGPSTDFGCAYETPLTSREDIFEDRVTVDLIQRF